MGRVSCRNCLIFQRNYLTSEGTALGRSGIHLSISGAVFQGLLDIYIPCISSLISDGVSLFLSLLWFIEIIRQNKQ